MLYAGADVVAVGYYRRGDLTTSLMPATYFVHGLAGYPPAVMSAHGLPTAAFLSAGVDPLTYATLPTYAAAAAAAQLQGSAAYDTNVSSDAATTSELSPASTQNGVIDSNGTGNYTPPGYGDCCLLSYYTLANVGTKNFFSASECLQYGNHFLTDVNMLHCLAEF